jgi:hypothetical protein
VKKYWDSGLIHESVEYENSVEELVPDFEAPDDIIFNQTRIGENNYYFVANQKESFRQIVCKFRTSGKQPEIWNPMNGEIVEATNWKILEDGRTEVTLEMTPIGALFVVFRKASKSKGENWPAPEFVTTTDLSKDWAVQFDPEWGPIESVQFKTLAPWNENANPHIKYYSGTAIYSKSFEISTLKLPLVIDLGDVSVMAKVILNGKDLGTLWKPPFRMDISSAAKTGTNLLQIEVTNLWVNRLIGDEQNNEKFEARPKNIPEWVSNANGTKSADGPLKSFAIHKYWDKNAELQPSGLIGPVRIVAIKY